MNPKPRCEVKFDANTGKFAECRFFNLRSNEREEQKRIAATHVEQITKQLECPHGLTNKERRRLEKERRVLQKAFLQKTTIDKTREAKQQKELKSADKELQRLVRKAAKERTH
jgi:hypothetical protein